MAEVQKHGFIFQDTLLIKVYGVLPEELSTIKYTSTFDCPKEMNRLNGVCLSIKFSSTPKGVNMGDPKRIFQETDRTDEEIHFVFGFFKQEGGKKVVKEIIEFNGSHIREKLFGTVTLEEILELEQKVKAVEKKRRQTPEEKKEIQSMKKELDKKSRYIHFNPKIDSKGQRRLQCSFINYTKFLEENPELLVKKGTSTDFHGNCVIEEIESGRRTFKKSPGIS